MIGDLNSTLGLNCTDFVFNHPDGGVKATLIDKKDHNKLEQSIHRFLEMATGIGCHALICGAGNVINGISKAEAMGNMVEILGRLAITCSEYDVTLLLEPFNTKIDHPDYFLDDPEACVKVLKAANHKNVKMLFDIYHMQIMAGNIVHFIRNNIEYIGHFHIAGVPGRHEPAECELNYRYILDEIDRSGYEGYVGLEYWPSKPSVISLKETMEYLGS